MTDSYSAFLERKFQTHKPSGFDADVSSWPLFEFQRDIVRWALRRGRCAIFADTGLGKTRMQLVWAEHVRRATGGDVIILAPLSVAGQTAREGSEIGISVNVVREPSDWQPGINVINYDRMHKVTDLARACAGVVLDESSIIKNYNSKTLAVLMDLFGRTQYKLCATATPSPNDYTELGQHAEFLGVCTREEMLAEFFLHDGGETQLWRLKGHARAMFWRWLSEFACTIRKPSDLGYDDTGYDLEPMRTHFHIFGLDKEDAFKAGQLFATEAAGLLDRRSARVASFDKRVKACCDLVNSQRDERWVVWCEYNDEGRALTAGIPGSVEIAGADSIDDKEQRMVDFINGKTRVLVTKPSIAGFGVNLQSVARTAFVGVSDSYEQYYQAVRRFWRFGQKRTVEVHLFASETEGAVVRNMARKQEQHETMSDELREYVRASVKVGRGTERSTNEYKPTKPATLPGWL